MTASRALALSEATAPAVTTEQIDLIKRTIAKDATPVELDLFFYDCKRRGVHPLDKLIHFTKRAGKYTPVVSIDYMRSRAAMTGDCAGIDDAIFTGTPKHDDFAATVTVYRLVHEQRCTFTACARWGEYKPELNDFMWRRMPHVMLGKCAEAAALRKGFPQELAGLYAVEELAQADAETGAIEQRTPEGDVIDTTTGEIKEAAPGELTNELPPEGTLPVGAAKLITVGQRKRLFTIASKKGWTEELLKKSLKAKFNLDSTKLITREQYDDVVSAFEEAPPVDPDQPF